MGCSAPCLYICNATVQHWVMIETLQSDQAAKREEKNSTPPSYMQHLFFVYADANRRQSRQAESMDDKLHRAKTYQAGHWGREALLFYLHCTSAPASAARRSGNTGRRVRASAHARRAHACTWRQTDANGGGAPVVRRSRIQGRPCEPVLTLLLTTTVQCVDLHIALDPHCILILTFLIFYK